MQWLLDVTGNDINVFSIFLSRNSNIGSIDVIIGSLI